MDANILKAWFESSGGYKDSAGWFRPKLMGDKVANWDWFSSFSALECWGLVLQASLVSGLSSKDNTKKNHH